MNAFLFFFFVFLNVTAGEREKRGLRNPSASNRLKERDYRTVGEEQYFKLSLNYGDELSGGGGHKSDQRLPLRAHTHTHARTRMYGRIPFASHEGK